jgi:hypothetical protein
LINGGVETETEVSLKAASGAEQFEQAVRIWETRLGAAEIRPPSKMRSIAETFKTAAAHNARRMRW